MPVKIKDLNWVRNSQTTGDDIQHSAYAQDGVHYFSVLDRRTGYSFSIRDTETAFVSLDKSTFFLRSGEFDIRDYPDLTVDEAVVLIRGEDTEEVLFDG